MELSELTRELIARSRVIAKGRGIRDLNRLTHEYGGSPSQWTKKSSPRIEIGGEAVDYH